MPFDITIVDENKATKMQENKYIIKAQSISLNSN